MGTEGDATAAGFTDIRRFDVLDSTNRYLADQARAGAPDGVVAVADHQTAGRGRLDRRWEAPPGTSLLVSVLFRTDVTVGDLFLCASAVALAGVDACHAAAGVEASVKWPNDLIIGGRKLAGVLAELVGPGTGPARNPAVVVGIGLNVTWAGPDGAGGTSLEAEAGRPVDREELLQALLAALAPRRRALEDAEGRRRLLHELRERTSTLGTGVRVELAGETIVGEAVALTDRGHLVVRTPAADQTGPQTGRAGPATDRTGPVDREVASGDVVHLRSSGPGAGAQ